MKDHLKFLWRRLHRWLAGTAGWRWLFSTWDDFEIAYRSADGEAPIFSILPEGVKTEQVVARFVTNGREYLIYRNG